jgi:DNA-binding transcriptional LysR family regulator
MLDYRVTTFLALCEEMNYRRTAEKLNMTQPGVTQHIQYLERYYGVKLFEYDGRTLLKTKNADRLKRHFDSMRAEEGALFDAFTEADGICLSVGATKTIGEFVIVPEIREFLRNPKHNLQLTVDNTENLLRMVEKSQIDFAVIEGVFDKSKYGYHLYKKENFVGICSENHRFANRTVSLQEIFEEDLLVREPFSGTRTLFENAISDRGFSLESFKRCISVSNFSVICDLVANVGAITFAYEPISRHRKDLATFSVQDMQICGEFNFVYCNGSVAHQKIESIFSGLPQGQ